MYTTLNAGSVRKNRGVKTGCLSYSPENDCDILSLTDCEMMAGSRRSGQEIAPYQEQKGRGGSQRKRRAGGLAVLRNGVLAVVT